MNVRGAEFWTSLLLVGLTAVFIGYLNVWLPGPSAGLRLIGLELGEWIKFLGVRQSRDLFYLPPILLGTIIALLTAGWRNDRWQTWVARTLAVLVGLLAFPAVAAITTEPRSEWLARLVGVALVFAASLAAALLASRRQSTRWVWWVVLVLCWLGLVLPLWQYAVVQPVVAEALRQPVGIGLGLWLNSAGFLLISLAAVRALLSPKENRSSPAA